MEKTAIRSQIHRLRSDMIEMRRHLDDMLGKMDSFAGLATRTADEADALARTLTKSPIRARRPFSGFGGWLTITGLTIAGLAIFSPRTLDYLWRQAQTYFPAISSRVSEATAGTPLGSTTGGPATGSAPTNQPPTRSRFP
jgi:hypothetical protein